MGQEMNVGVVQPWEECCAGAVDDSVGMGRGGIFLVSNPHNSVALHQDCIGVRALRVHGDGRCVAKAKGGKHLGGIPPEHDAEATSS